MHLTIYGIGSIMSSMSKLRDNTLAVAALGHFSVDLFGGLLPVLLAQLSVIYGLSNKEIGFAVVSYTLSSALSQPLFGHLGDRVGGRLVATMGIVWIAVWMAIAGFAPNYYLLVASLTLAGLGSGAYHPQGAVSATVNAKKGSGFSIFFVGGRLAFTVAPLLGGLMFATLGPSAMGLVSILALLIALAVWNSFPAHFTGKAKSDGTSAPSVPWLSQVPLLALAGFIVSQGLRGGINESYGTYLPKLGLDQGLAPSQYGLLASAFIGGSSIGGLIGGFLADRWNKKWIISGSMLLAVPVMYAFIHSGSETRLIWALLTGALLAIPFTPVILIVQGLMPNRPSFITGVAFSFFFVSGALATALVGILADIYGLAEVMGAAAGILAIASVFSLLLPSRMGSTPRVESRAASANIPVESDASQ